MTELDVSAILAADDARLAAMCSGDVAQLERLMSCDCSYLHNSGLTERRSAYLDRIREERVRYIRVERHDAETRMYGDTGVMTGYVIAQSQTFPDGVIHDRDTHFLAVWRRTADGWQMVAYASTKRTSKR